MRAGSVYLTDGNAFFNRPGPRVVESAEILAEIMHGLDFGHRRSGFWKPLVTLPAYPNVYGSSQSWSNPAPPHEQTAALQFPDGPYQPQAPQVPQAPAPSRRVIDCSAEKYRGKRRAHLFAMGPAIALTADTQDWYIW
jgi:hypothetical protein